GRLVGERAAAFDAHGNRGGRAVARRPRAPEGGHRVRHAAADGSDHVGALPWVRGGARAGRRRRASDRDGRRGRSPRVEPGRGGGGWRQVKVGYPGNIASPGWGRRPGGIVALSILAGAAAFGLFVLSGQLERLANTGPASQADNLTIGELAALGIGAVVALAALIQFVRGAIDLFAKRDVTG